MSACHPRAPTCVEGAAPAVTRDVPTARLVVPRLPRLLHRHRQAVGGDEEVGRGKTGQVIGRISQPAGVWGAGREGGKRQLVETKGSGGEGRALQPAGVWHGKGREEGGAGVWWTRQASRSGACAARRPSMRPTSMHARLAQAHANARSVRAAPESDTITVCTCSSSRMVSTSWTCIREGGECGVSRVWSQQAVESAGCRERERAGEGNAGMPLHVAVRKATLGSFGFGR